MRQLKLSLAVIAIIGIVAACKKDNKSPNSIDIEGAWMGTWEHPTGSDDFFSLHFHNNGRLLIQMNDDLGTPVYNDPLIGGALGVGTWEQQRDSIVANYTIDLNHDDFVELDENFSLTLKKTASTQVTGTIGTGASKSGFGNFVLNKPEASTSEGSWMGTYTYDNIPGAQNLPYALHLTNDGSPTFGFAIVESTNPNDASITSIALGDWLIEGDSIKTTCKNFVNGSANFFVEGKRNGSTLTGKFGLIQAGVKQPPQGGFQLQKK